MSEVFRLLGTPRFGGILVVSDHASNHVPADIALGIAPDLLTEHMAIDIGVAEVGALLAQRPGFAAFQCGVSRLVCDVNREEDAPGAVAEASDGHAIPGNMLDAGARAARIARFHGPYHTALAAQLDAMPPALILSLHSFTPALRTCDKPRPWQVAVLYNNDDRAARLALPLLEAEGLVVGDQQPYSGKQLNYTMNRHAEAEGRPYLGIEIRQDQIADAAGQARWAEILFRVANAVALRLGE
ncbi:N-formylglutamate amidohydrolase [Novosphingobium flavum]|uniref:N-formylglutamate amidohydrolase n=1 Tax=Novosphingobium aerophilum TaxID=2839843 RepID=UPI00163A8D59|nr:N-formylglutamate amidohydrolase [Novosphingobium aerophilum]MBC2663278.1 N-formylglutamate amidohydrolase [Novosphingobium aerophilum]